MLCGLSTAATKQLRSGQRPTVGKSAASMQMDARKDLLSDVEATKHLQALRCPSLRQVHEPREDAEDWCLQWVN